MKNLYTVFEGGEGVGKSSLSKNYAKYIGAHWTNEPNNQLDTCKILRELAIKHNDEMTKEARELILIASRSISLNNIILPRLMNGEKVVSDRSLITGMVYAHKELWNWTFKKWMQLANISEALPAIPDRVIFVTANERNPVGDANDKYDNMPEAEHQILDDIFNKMKKEVSSLLDPKLETLGRDKIEIVEFKLNFKCNEADNLIRLLEQLEEA